MKTRVSVFGSFDAKRAEKEKNTGFKLDKSFPEFEGACKELGRRLAKAGVILNACSDTPDTADFHVTTGFLECAKDLGTQASCVHVYRPVVRKQNQKKDNGRTPVFQDLLDEIRSGLIKLAAADCDSWNVAHLRALRNSDAVITIGGLLNTYAIGMAAILAEKRLVPIGTFGGASSRLLKELNSELKAIGGIDTEMLASPCTSKKEYDVLDAAVRMCRDKPRVFMIHGHSSDWRSIASFIEKDIGLKVIDMKTEGEPGETIPARFLKHASSVAAAIAVVTPDDVGWDRKNDPWQCRPRGRQNVWFEVGWFWARLKPDRLMLLVKKMPDGSEIEIPSNLNGLDVTDYEEPISVREEVDRFLRLVEGVSE